MPSAGHGKDCGSMNAKFVQEIQTLRHQRQAVILAHYYQCPEVQEIADYVGDSLDLSRRARDTEAEVIVFCGVRFMAETAKALNPEKTVLLPEPSASCPMAEMVTPEDIRRLRADHPGAAVVCYVNSSIEIKACSDICCTSANAVSVVRSLKESKIIFVPDQNLGHYVSAKVPEKRVILHSGFCPTHHRISPENVRLARRAHPAAPVLVHPECPPSVVAQADFTGSTGQILDYVANSPAAEFIIGTEGGILYRLKALHPEKRFYLPGGSIVCPNMKKISLESVYRSLKDLRYRMELDEQTAFKAAACLEKMFSVS